MNTRIDEIADDIYRLSSFVPDIGPTGFTFNQYLILDDQPLIFHTGHRSTFPDLAKAIASILPIDKLRWVTFGHVEADECGAMNQLLAAAPRAQIAHGASAAWCHSTTWPTGRPCPSRTVKSSTWATTRSATSTPHTSRSLGGPRPVRRDHQHAPLW